MFISREKVPAVHRLAPMLLSIPSVCLFHETQKARGMFRDVSHPGDGWRAREECESILPLPGWLEDGWRTVFVQHGAGDGTSHSD